MAQEPYYSHLRSYLNDYQDRINTWTISTFGQQHLFHKIERSFRALEEVTEAVQAAGLTEEEAIRVIKQVYSKPVEPVIAKELGAALFCTIQLCTCFSVDPEKALQYTLKDAWDRQEIIRKKHQLKPARIPELDQYIPGDPPDVQKE